MEHSHTKGKDCPACKTQSEEALTLTLRLFKILTAERIPRNHATCAALLACAANCLGDGESRGTDDRDELAWFLRQAMTLATRGETEVTATVLELGQDEQKN